PMHVEHGTSHRAARDVPTHERGGLAGLELDRARRPTRTEQVLGPRVGDLRPGPPGTRWHRARMSRPAARGHRASGWNEPESPGGSARTGQCRRLARVRSLLVSGPRAKLSGIDSTWIRSAVVAATHPGGRMDQKFTVKATEALADAIASASAAKSPQLEPAHLLAALLAQDGGVAVGLLDAVGADKADLGRRARAGLVALPTLSGPTTAQPQASRATGAVLESARKEAEALGDEYISTEHLLLGLAAGSDAAAQAL